MLDVPTLTVAPSGRVYLSRALCSRLSLRPAQHVDIVPPRAKGGGKWHLDCRLHGPVPKLPRKPQRRPEFRSAYQLQPGHFSRMAGRGRPRITFDRLVFVLDTEVADRFYRLRQLDT